MIRFVDVLAYLNLLFQTGLGNLAAYLAVHVLLCLLLAFFIAGALGGAGRAPQAVVVSGASSAQGGSSPNPRCT